MPYLFAVLLLLNGAFLGYSLFLKKDGEDASVVQAKASLQSPIEFKNTTDQLPPEIGSKSN